jgi:hypothetical protein
MRFVGPRFDGILANIALTEAQQRDGTTKQLGVRGHLNAHYYSSSRRDANSGLVGSWGKRTCIRPPRDIDVLFVLPALVHARFELRYTMNRQSALLQEVKGVLQHQYPNTELRADGQVVSVPFVSYAVEVVPAFVHQNSFWICDTNDGGCYKRINPLEEEKRVEASDRQTNGNTRALIRLLKCWQGNCHVPLKSFWLELLAMRFLASWAHAGKSSVYYDWMMRDFLHFLLQQVNNPLIASPSPVELIPIGNAWQTRARSAYARAVKACAYESQEKSYDAFEQWSGIFGDVVPTLSA